MTNKIIWSSHLFGLTTQKAMFAIAFWFLAEYFAICFLVPYASVGFVNNCNLLTIWSHNDIKKELYAL